MNKEKSRMYIPYIQYIDMIEKLSDETSKELILKIADFCTRILDIDLLANNHEKRFKDNNGDNIIVVEKNNLLTPIYNAGNKIDSMIQLAFLVNKCTKPNSIKKEEKAKINNKNLLDEIRKDYNSNDEKRRKEALKKLSKLTEEEFAEWFIEETEIGSDIFQGIINVDAQDPQFRFYKGLTGWDAGDSWGPQEKDEGIEAGFDADGNFPNAEFSDGVIMKGKGSWIFKDFTGGKIDMTVDLNAGTVKFTVVEDEE